MQVKLVNILTYFPLLSYKNNVITHNSKRYAVQYERPLTTLETIGVVSLVYYLHCGSVAFLLPRWSALCSLHSVLHY